MDKEEKKKIPQDTAPEGTVNVNKDSLKKLTDRLEDLESKVDYVADEGRKQKYEDKHRVEELTQVKLSICEGKIVVGWGDMPTNLVEERAGVLITDQTRLLYLDDGSEKKLPQDATINFPRINASITARKILTDLDSDGNPIEMLDLLTEDGNNDYNNKKLTLASKFVN